MYLCICHAVTDEDVREHVQAGASSAEEVGDICGAGTGCGSCLDRLDDLVATAMPERCPLRALAGLARTA